MPLGSGSVGEKRTGTLYAHDPKGNEFPGNVKWVQIDLEKDDHDDLISPVDRFKIAMAQQ